MCEQDQLVYEAHLVDVDEARAFAEELRVTPEGEVALGQVVAELNTSAMEATQDLGLPHSLRFVVCRITRWPEGHEDAVQAWLEADNPTEPEPADPGVLIGFKVLVMPVSRERAERIHREGPGFRAKSWHASVRREADLRARRPRGARARGAGRPGHRSSARANAPPADSDDGEPEPPHPVARLFRRALCWVGR
jgi:hypothetical protein